MQRYFVDKDFNFSNNDKHHIKNVMRNTIGSKLVCVSNNESYLCEIIDINSLQIKIIEKLKENNELNNNITLIYALPKREKLELVIQKACELGVNKIVLFQSNRSVMKLQDKYETKIKRYLTIAKEACEQSERLIIPSIIYETKLSNLNNYLSDLNLVAYEKEEKINLKKQLTNLNNQSISIYVGAEGGIINEELSYLNEIGFINCSLGKRILRSETAVIYLLSILSFYSENKG